MAQFHVEQLCCDVQAHVFAAVMDNQQIDSSSPSAQQQRDVLAAALTSAVWQVAHVLSTCGDKPAFVCMYLSGLTALPESM